MLFGTETMSHTHHVVFQHYADMPRAIIYKTFSVLRLLVVYHRCGMCVHEVRHDRTEV